MVVVSLSVLLEADVDIRRLQRRLMGPLLSSLIEHVLEAEVPPIGQCQHWAGRFS